MPMALKAAALRGCCNQTPIGKKFASVGNPLTNPAGRGCASSATTAAGRTDSMATARSADSMLPAMYRPDGWARCLASVGSLPIELCCPTYRGPGEGCHDHVVPCSWARSRTSASWLWQRRIDYGAPPDYLVRDERSQVACPTAAGRRRDTWHPSRARPSGPTSLPSTRSGRSCARRPRRPCATSRRSAASSMRPS